ncbi:MAG: phosphatase PAP2 family protein [Saprospiraceae bacterium]|nr:phosphatase PAP2 family protein [Saprospiraceae bacterium]
MNFVSLMKCSAIFFMMVLIGSCRSDEDVKPKGGIPASEFSGDVAVQWYSLLEEIDRYATGYRPPAAARAMGYIGLAGYESAVAGIPGNSSLEIRFPGLALPEVELEKEYHWPTAVNAAYATMFRSFYPHIRQNQRIQIDALEDEFFKQSAADAGQELANRSAEYGRAVARSIFEWSRSDALGNNGYLSHHPSSYVPPSGLGLWQPTKPDFTPALFPYWGQVRTFALGNHELRARPPLPFSEDSNSPFSTQARETMAWVNEIRAGKDIESHWIAEFWSDDFFEVTFTPPGRWIAITNQVLRIERPDLATSVELYAKMGMAMSDASIAIWESKFYYNVERPVQFIERNFDPNWLPILKHTSTGLEGITPEFPTYPSGHSGFGGAAATILTDFLGYQYRFTDRCHEGRSEFRGAPRTFDSFIAMAVENAYSRVPLGVHFRMDCDEGLRQGYLAGQRVLELPWKEVQ